MEISVHWLHFEEFYEVLSYEFCCQETHEFVTLHLEMCIWGLLVSNEPNKAQNFETCQGNGFVSDHIVVLFVKLPPKLETSLPFHTVKYHSRVPHRMIADIYFSWHEVSQGINFHVTLMFCTYCQYYFIGLLSDRDQKIESSYVW